MIGVFDSGLGGLTVLRVLIERFKAADFVYLADHAHVPYGNRPSEDIVDYTRDCVEDLFDRGAKLVLLGCNTATAVALRRLQQQWLPKSQWAGTHNVLGIVAPTVEGATQTPWAVTSPQYPQKYNTDTIAVFGTTRTVTSGVYPEEIRKRCPKVTVVQQICSELAGAIEEKRPEAELDGLVREGVARPARRRPRNAAASRDPRMHALSPCRASVPQIPAAVHAHPFAARGRGRQLRGLSRAQAALFERRRARDADVADDRRSASMSAKRPAFSGPTCRLSRRA